MGVFFFRKPVFWMRCEEEDWRVVRTVSMLRFTFLILPSFPTKAPGNEISPGYHLNRSAVEEWSCAEGFWALFRHVLMGVRFDIAEITLEHCILDAC